MAIVFDNIIFGLQRSGGISRFWSNLIEIGDVINSDNCHFIEPPNASENILRQKVKLNHSFPDRTIPVCVSRYLDFGSSFGLKSKYKCSVFHSSYYRLCKEPGVANITTVHDLIYEKFAHGYSKLAHVLQKRKALQWSDCITCVSENTKQDLFHYYPEIAGKDVRVIHNGVDGFEDQSRLGIFNVLKNEITPHTYFLYVGHRGVLKGFDKVFAVLRSYKDIALIVVGSPFTPKETGKFQLHGFSRRVINVGTVNDFDLNVLYSNAKFLFFPSLYEGFGIPPIEAMMSRCPVIASSTSSIPEVVGDAALLFDPCSEDHLDKVVDEIRRDDARARLIKKGVERSKLFSWGAVRSKYADIYNEYG